MQPITESSYAVASLFQQSLQREPGGGYITGEVSGGTAASVGNPMRPGSFFTGGLSTTGAFMQRSFQVTGTGGNGHVLHSRLTGVIRAPDTEQVGLEQATYNKASDVPGVPKQDHKVYVPYDPPNTHVGRFRYTNQPLQATLPGRGVVPPVTKEFYTQDPKTKGSFAYDRGYYTPPSSTASVDERKPTSYHRSMHSLSEDVNSAILPDADIQTPHRPGPGGDGQMLDGGPISPYAMGAFQVMDNALGRQYRGLVRREARQLPQVQPSESQSPHLVLDMDMAALIQEQAKSRLEAITDSS